MEDYTDSMIPAITGGLFECFLGSRGGRRNRHEKGGQAGSARVALGLGALGQRLALDVGLVVRRQVRKMIGVLARGGGDDGGVEVAEHAVGIDAIELNIWFRTD